MTSSDARRVGRMFLVAFVLAFGLSIGTAIAAEPLVIGTASPGGPYLSYGQELARILSRELSQEVTAQATQGPAQNIVLLEKGEIGLAFVTMGVALQGWNGTDWAKGTRYRSMRAIFPMYDTAFQFVAPKRIGATWLEDLASLRVGAGPRAGTGGSYLPLVFKALDVQATIRYGAWGSLATQLKEGELDSVVFVGGTPFPALAELNAEQPLDFVQPSAEQLAIIRQKLPEISPSLVPAGSYPSLERDYQTFGVYNFAVAHKDMPENLVYTIVKAVFEKRPELMKAQPSARETVPENVARDTFLPLHPGAVRYYREHGIALPASILTVTE